MKIKISNRIIINATINNTSLLIKVNFHKSTMVWQDHCLMYRKAFYIEQKQYKYVINGKATKYIPICTNTEIANNAQPYNNKTDMKIIIILETLSTKIGKMFRQ